MSLRDLGLLKADFVSKVRYKGGTECCGLSISFVTSSPISFSASLLVICPFFYPYTSFLWLSSGRSLLADPCTSMHTHFYSPHIFLLIIVKSQIYYFSFPGSWVPWPCIEALATSASSDVAPVQELHHCCLCSSLTLIPPYKQVHHLTQLAVGWPAGAPFRL